ncbi:DUF4249 family protein [Maribacter algarum]|uniref:DUF4249 family protein n=1 Tax=Maribacter algarum (ex Zhang et al. 2020) TaxID=2578118 RepID=A0A5S3PHB3_9FLAO|nr:DUF4249 family protein [Maribacter algarum]TMM53638.1 DUF4249 family protein [Maribacter algarum]
MKKVFSLVFVILFFTGCEDVIEVDVPQTPPRLAIDALIRLDASKAITTVEIKANLTSSFFGDITPAELTNISIINPDYVPTSPLDSQALPLNELIPGVYQASKSTIFFTEGELQLAIQHDGQRYLALTRFVPSSPIISLEQGDGTLFAGNETEVEVAFTDNPDREDFYLVDLDFGDYLVTEDEFYNGQTFRFSYFYDEGVEPGREINISLLGVDEPFYNYMNQLIVQSGGDQGPFQTPSATVRGNIINITNIDNVNSFDNVEDSDNFALGYFAVCQTFTDTIIIE